jgi:hypothetical protein
MQSTERHRLDRSMGLLSFDSLESFTPRRLKVLWLENTLDCRMWYTHVQQALPSALACDPSNHATNAIANTRGGRRSYYCDVRKAMARFHELCTPLRTSTCLGFNPDVAIIGPRYSINIQSEDDHVGFDRTRYPNLPLLILQNKMYTPDGWREIVGNASAKVAWARSTGAAAAFTWLTMHHEFTRQSGVPHHFLPFGVDMSTFGAHAGEFNAQRFDVGFTGASGHDKYPLRSKLLQALKSMVNISGFYGTWQQTSLNRADPRSWKAGDRRAYASQLAQSRIWLSTTGPSNLVGTRSFEVLASGTTLLICNRPAPGQWIYDGLFEEGVHVVMFDDVDSMRSQVLRYLSDEPARRRIVQNAHALATAIHSWDSRARFISRIAEASLSRQMASPFEAHRYAPPPGARRANDSSYLGCYIPRTQQALGSVSEPERSRNHRKLRRYTVASCIASCDREGKRFASVVGGGFSTGNGHAHARCACATTDPFSASPAWRRRPNHECATTCNLHDARPCGGYKAHALFEGAGAGAKLPSASLPTRHDEPHHG